jgi:hypothetical protein
MRTFQIKLLIYIPISLVLVRIDQLNLLMDQIFDLNVKKL